MSTTKDERFVLALYKKAKESGNIENTFNCYEIGSSVGLQFRAVDAICRLLIQSNFIKKKKGEDEIYLTPRGIELAENLLSESH
jgi:predicted transcriptional regulator